MYAAKTVILRHRHWFDLPVAVGLALINGAIVFWINSFDTSGATVAGSTQIILSLIVPGIMTPHVKRQVREPRQVVAYTKALLVIPGIVMIVLATVHWVVATPDLLTTVLIIGGATWVLIAIYLMLARHTTWLPDWV